MVSYLLKMLIQKSLTVWNNGYLVYELVLMDLESKCKVCFLKVCSDLVKNAYIKSYGYFKIFSKNNLGAKRCRSHPKFEFFDFFPVLYI